jgi:hypothetical protein
VAVQRIYTDVQDLGIELGELLAVAVERRYLVGSGRRPVDRVKSYDHMLLAAIIAESDSGPQLTFHCRQLEIRSRISHFQRHAFSLDLHCTVSPPNTKGGLSAALVADWKSGLNGLHVFGLPALGTLHYVELDLLTFLQAAESLCLDGREVYEHILPILAADETITFGVVKPLYCSCFHGVALFLFVLDMRSLLAGLLQAGHAG